MKTSQIKFINHSANGLPNKYELVRGNRKVVILEDNEVKKRMKVDFHKGDGTVNTFRFETTSEALGQAVGYLVA